MSNRLLIAIYTVIALVALVATWGQNLAYFGPTTDGVFPLVTFWAETKANPASRSVTVDLLFLLLAGVVFMVLEARRLGIRFVWLYVFFGGMIAISVTFPLFMIARQLRLAAGAAGPATPARATAGDLAGLAVTAVAILALSGFILRP